MLPMKKREIFIFLWMFQHIFDVTNYFIDKRNEQVTTEKKYSSITDYAIKQQFSLEFAPSTTWKSNRGSLTSATTGQKKRANEEEKFHFMLCLV